MRLLRDAEEPAVALIRAHRPELGQLVSLLLEQETVDSAAVYRIVGKPVPGHRGPRELAIAPVRGGKRAGRGQGTAQRTAMTVDGSPGCGINRMSVTDERE